MVTVCGTLALMSKTPNKPKKKMNATADRHKGFQLPSRVSAEMRDALKAYADQERRSVSQVVVLLLEEALATKGFWPPEGK